MGKYENDLATVNAILAKPELTSADHMQLLAIYSVSFHDSGKIEGCCSCDSSCHNCAFCQKMIEHAANNPLVICGYCYDNAQETRWKNTEKRHGLNMRILSSVDFTLEELATLPITAICRFNSSGDVPNKTYARNCIKIAMSHPYAKTALWAKNVPDCEKAFDELGKPANMIFVQSSLLIGIACKRSRYADYTFTVYPDEQTTQAAISSGARECNGKKCRECGYKCYMGTWEKGTNIAELLRVHAKTRAAIMAEYNKRVIKAGE